MDHTHALSVSRMQVGKQHLHALTTPTPSFSVQAAGPGGGGASRPCPICRHPISKATVIATLTDAEAEELAAFKGNTEYGAKVRVVGIG